MDYPVVKGQVWLWHDVKCLVKRVAKDGTWADITVYSNTTWGKRMLLPFPEGFVLTGEYVIGF